MVDDGLQIVGSAVSIVDVIGMLPHVDAENGLAAVDERVLAVRGLGCLDLAALQGEPAPTGAELGDARLDEVFLGLVDRAERILERPLDLALDLPPPLGFIHRQK